MGRTGHHAHLTDGVGLGTEPARPPATGSITDGERIARPETEHPLQVMTIVVVELRVFDIGDEDVRAVGPVGRIARTHVKADLIFEKMP
jgi:hypothetical protein